MNNKKEYWQWKSTIIDFDTISDEKADFGDYITKKEMIFQYLGTPDKEIHEWYNGGYSCEYNYALKYAKELGLVEEYIDYDDIIYNLQYKIDKAIDKINQYELIVGYYDSNYDEYDDTYSHEIKDELLDSLKEDK